MFLSVKLNSSVKLCIHCCDVWKINSYRMNTVIYNMLIDSKDLLNAVFIPFTRQNTKIAINYKPKLHHSACKLQHIHLSLHPNDISCFNISFYVTDILYFIVVRRKLHNPKRFMVNAKRFPPYSAKKTLNSFNSSGKRC